MSASRSQMARSAAVGLVGGVVGAGANLLLAVVVGRALGAAGAGPFFQAVAIVAIASNVLELGADTGLVRQVSAAVALGRADRVRGLVRTATVPVSTVIALVVLAGAATAPALPSLAAHGRGWVVLVLAGSGATALIAVLLGALRGLTSVVPVTLVQNVGLPLGRLALVGACVLAGVDSWRPVTVAWMVPVPVALVVAAALLVRAERRRRGTRRPVPPTESERREFWAFSAPRGVSAAAEICLEWADVLIVGALCSPAEAGVYAVVSRAARSAELVQQASRLAVGPTISAALAQGRLGAVRRLHGDVAVGTTLLSWPFFVIAAYFAPELLGLFGPEFADGATALRVLCLGLALSYGVGAVQSILLMGGGSTAQLGNKVACLIVNVGLNLLLVPRLGIVGAAIAWASVMVLDAALACWQIQLGMRVRLRLHPAYAAGAGAAVATAGVCLLVEALGIDSMAAMSSATFVVVAVGAATVVAFGRSARDRFARDRSTGPP